MIKFQKGHNSTPPPLLWLLYLLHELVQKFFMTNLLQLIKLKDQNGTKNLKDQFVTIK